MADTRFKIIIDAQNRAQAAFRQVTSDVDKFRTRLKGFEKEFQGLAVAGGAVFAGTAVGIKQAIGASAELESALTGLSSVASAFGQDAESAQKAAQSLAEDGLLSVKDASNSLKNLLATGFSLPEAIELMNGFKDAAAFNRQGTLAFGQAIEGATQGIKNQNSILVDNAGITKNLSNILKEAGLSAQDLSKVTSDATVRQALFNGILREASAFQGDAARAADTLSGKQAQLATAAFNAKAAIGDALAPAINDLLDSITPLLSTIEKWVRANPELTKRLIQVTLVVSGVAAAVGALGLAMIFLLPALGAGVAVLKGMAVATVVLLGPLGLAAAAIAGVTILVAIAARKFLDFTNQFQTFGDGYAAFWLSLKQDTFNIVADILEAVDSLLGGALSGTVARWRAAAQEAGEQFNTLAAATLVTTEDTSRGLQQIIDEVISTFSVGTREVKNSLSTVSEAAEEQFKKTVDSVKELRKEIREVAKELKTLEDGFNDDVANLEVGFTNDAAKLVAETQVQLEQLEVDRTSALQQGSKDRVDAINAEILEKKRILQSFSNAQLNIDANVAEERKRLEMDAFARLQFDHNKRLLLKQAEFLEEKAQRLQRLVELNAEHNMITALIGKEATAKVEAELKKQESFRETLALETEELNNWFANSINGYEAYVTSVNQALSKIKAPTGGGGSFFNPNFGFANGGIVPGNVGEPVIATLHGGEEVIPFHQRGSTSPEINIVINGGIFDDVDEFGRMLVEKIKDHVNI